MAKVSIIVPIYAVEQYIERCIRSLFEQTLDDLEYIFVNDCTPDKSLEVLHKIIQEYPNRIDQVKIINHETNRGSAAARKTGIDASNGEYIVHCDSDDWAEADMLSAMYNKAINTNADIVICDYIVTDGSGQDTRYYGVLPNSSDEILLQMLQGKIAWTTWNKLVSKKLYENDIIYPKYSNGEDMVLMSQLMYYARRIEYISEPYYFYFKNTLSITKNISETAVYNRFIQGVNNVMVVQEFFSDKLKDLLYRDAIDKMKFIQLRLLIPLLRTNKKKYYNFWKGTFPELKFRLWKNSNVNLVNKIKYYLCLLGIVITKVKVNTSSK